MKKRVLTDVRVSADLSKAVYYWRDKEHYARQIEDAVKEFQSFIRDHRSMDYVHLDVEKEYQDQCSHCGSEWETDFDSAPVCCNSAIDEHNSLCGVKP